MAPVPQGNLLQLALQSDQHIQMLRRRVLVVQLHHLGEKPLYGFISEKSRCLASIRATMLAFFMNSMRDSRLLGLTHKARQGISVDLILRITYSQNTLNHDIPFRVSDIAQSMHDNFRCCTPSTRYLSAKGSGTLEVLTAGRQQPDNQLRQEQFLVQRHGIRDS